MLKFLKIFLVILLAKRLRT